jgi:RNA polymerase sigma-54 factor
VIGCLDDRGFLSCAVDDVASDLGVEQEHVEQVLDVVQSLEPTGIGARDARECLLIQLEDLCQDGVERDVAKRLIADEWDRLGRSSLSNIGRDVGASVDEVREALRYVRENLNPFPAYTWWARSGRAPSENRTICPEPDVVIREDAGTETGYEVELPRAGKHGLRVSKTYCQAMDDLTDDSGSTDDQGWSRWQELCGRARLFVRSIEQRWQTLHDLMDCLVDCQRDFLVDGERHLKPLTRAQVAEMMDVHESTVSRAVAGKYVLLPCGKVVPMDIFFDSAAPIKHLIQELVDQEETALSDSAIVEKLKEQGYDIARRTVAKHRNALNILPSSLRRRSKEL